MNKELTGPKNITILVSNIKLKKNLYFDCKGYKIINKFIASNDRSACSSGRNFSQDKIDQYSSNQADTTIQKDTIFIQNLPKNVTIDELVASFGSIGVIKNDKKTSQPKIWIYKDKNTGEGKGEATITYDDW
jgi:hypothetical protein